MSAAPIRAQAVLYSGRGGYEVISVGERLVRPPKAGEIRIRVHAAAVNPTDVLLRDPGLGDLAAPMTPGMDVAGVVEAVGEGVIRLAPGDEIMAAVSPMRPEGGAQAAYLVAPAGWATPKPKGLSLVQAATLPMNGLTALYALDLAGLSPGQSLAVSGGAGWLAYQTIVIAKQRGLRVLADAKPDEIDRVRAYGADVVVERGPDYSRAIRRAAPDGADALIDTALLGAASFGAIRDNGVYIPVRGWRDGAVERGLQVRPVLVNQVLDRTDWLDALGQLVEAGHIAPLVAAEFKPADVAQAQKLLSAGGLRGRPVIVF
jgi:NADPH2:quinone reductase